MDKNDMLSIIRFALQQCKDSRVLKVTTTTGEDGQNQLIIATKGGQEWILDSQSILPVDDDE